ncbi:MAG: regulator SirB [Zetaproteobacteria bacterium]|nr:MAG: regulator SirB [Zetaproteobacteria bacterium]
MVETIAAVKALHMTLAATSFGGFLGRWWWIVHKKRGLARLWRRLVPDLVDTMLLLTGLSLRWLEYQAWPLWLKLKLGCVLGYIALGILALRGRRRWAGAASVLCFAAVVWLALTKPIS